MGIISSNLRGYTFSDEGCVPNHPSYVRRRLCRPHHGCFWQKRPQRFGLAFGRTRTRRALAWA